MLVSTVITTTKSLSSIRLLSLIWLISQTFERFRQAVIYWNWMCGRNLQNIHETINVRCHGPFDIDVTTTVLSTNAKNRRTDFGINNARRVWNRDNRNGITSVRSSPGVRQEGRTRKTRCRATRTPRAPERTVKFNEGEVRTFWERKRAMFAYAYGRKTVLSVLRTHDRPEMSFAVAVILSRSFSSRRVHGVCSHALTTRHVLVRRSELHFAVTATKRTQRAR